MKHLLMVLMLSLSISSIAQVKSAPATYVIWQLDTDQVIDERNTELVRPMASITKLMTAYVVVNSGLSLDDRVTVNGPEASSRIRRGQYLTRRELLELTLVNSDNLAARTLAETTGLGYPQFIERMNYMARQLSMNNTVYVDSTGLLAENVTTTDDLRRLVQTVSNYAVFNQAAMMAGTSRTVTGRQKSVTVFNSNTNWLAGKLDILAAKTGTTNAAGKCLTMLFDKNGHRYLLVVLGARHAQERQILVQNLIDKIN
jgi:D-alanyl-D-alanine endopeptidase (penicillin-binding protein 7)